MTTEPTTDVSHLIENGDAIDASLRRTFEETVRRHRAYGVPLAVWRDGRVQHLPADQVVLPVMSPTPERA